MESHLVRFAGLAGLSCSFFAAVLPLQHIILEF